MDTEKDLEIALLRQQLAEAKTVLARLRERSNRYRNNYGDIKEADLEVRWLEMLLLVKDWSGRRQTDRI